MTRMNWPAIKGQNLVTTHGSEPLSDTTPRNNLYQKKKRKKKKVKKKIHPGTRENGKFAVCPACGLVIERRLLREHQLNCPKYSLQKRTVQTGADKHRSG